MFLGDKFIFDIVEIHLSANSINWVTYFSKRKSRILFFSSIFCCSFYYQLFYICTALFLVLTKQVFPCPRDYEKLFPIVLKYHHLPSCELLLIFLKTNKNEHAAAENFFYFFRRVSLWISKDFWQAKRCFW